MPIRHAPWADAPPDFAIGLSPIDEAAWLEGGEDDPAARKDPLFEQARALVWAETEGSRPGQRAAAHPAAPTCRRSTPPPAWSPTTCA